MVWSLFTTACCSVRGTYCKVVVTLSRYSRDWSGLAYGCSGVPHDDMVMLEGRCRSGKAGAGLLSGCTYNTRGSMCQVGDAVGRSLGQRQPKHSLNCGGVVGRSKGCKARGCPTDGRADLGGGQ